MLMMIVIYFQDRVNQIQGKEQIRTNQTLFLRYCVVALWLYLFRIYSWERSKRFDSNFANFVMKYKQCLLNRIWWFVWTESSWRALKSFLQEISKVSGRNRKIWTVENILQNLQDINGCQYRQELIEGLFSHISGEKCNNGGDVGD